MIYRKIFFCIDLSLLFMFFRWFLTFFDVYQTATPWLRIDLTMTKYMRLFVVIVSFHVNFVIVCIVFCRVISFAKNSRMCDAHRNLKFNSIFNILTFVFEITTCFSSFTMTVMLNFFEILEKWISSCFCSLNLISCVLIYSMHLSYIWISIRQFCFVDSLYVRMLISSTKSWELIFSLMSSHRSNSSAL